MALKHNFYLFFILDTDATEVQFCGQQQQLKLSLSGAAGRLHAREAIILIGSLSTLVHLLVVQIVFVHSVCMTSPLSLYLYLSAFSHSSALTRTN